MRTFRLLACLALLGAASCSDAPPTSGESAADVDPDIPTVDAAGEDGVAADVGPVDASADGSGDGGLDVGVDVADTAACRTLGCPCEADEDCNADYCVRDPAGGRVCAEFCDEACSLEGFECRTLRDGGGDLVRYCVPVGDPYCAPCEIDADCLATDNLCLEQADGRFCATGCGDGEACPDGASCTGVVLGGGDRVLVCVPDSDQCADCIDGDGDQRGVGPACLGYDCNDDDGGVYEGAPEACDGIDNDCDDDVDEGYDTLGEPCGTCDSGAYACQDLEVACIGDLGAAALNACGGCDVLDGAVGDACGDCGRGRLACIEGETDGLYCAGDTTNACGGCADLPNPAGGACDSGCGAGEWTCSESGETTFCLGEGTNACGGCAALPETIGEACEGACGAGVWACVDGEPNEVTCDDGVVLNACGGCASLDAAPGESCGPCGLDTYRCGEDAGLACTGETVGNACGGCGALDGAPDTSCGPCDAVWVCGTDERVDCVGDTTDSDGDTVCDVDDRCDGFDDREDADGDGIPDGCDGPPPECAADDDCPGDLLGEWSACGGYEGTCGNEGTRSRSRTEYRCAGGACEATTTMETEGCSRDTTGTSCDETAYGAWASCGGFDGVCDEGGTRARSVTTYACADGACAALVDEESEVCARDTDDIGCGEPAFTDWSVCGGYEGTCDETGTQSRMRTDYVCDAGGCAAVETVEERPCDRDTDGTTCGERLQGSWGSCDGFDTTCDASGTRARSITDFVCVTGACMPDVGSESEACTRDTDGASCGTSAFSDWSSCGDFSSACDESGNQTRTRTDYACADEGCAASVVTESRPCSRTTTGLSCAADAVGAWSACGDYSGTCDESGSRTRNRTTYACGDGACLPSSSTESEACGRDTDGGSCGTTVYGAWSACGGYSGTCGEMGTRSRSVTTYACGTGTCRTSTTTQTEPCARDTDGISCGADTFGTWSACGGFGTTCGESGTRSRTVTSYACVAGACGTSATPQSESCARDTDGVSCGSTTYGAWGTCGGFASTCDESGTQTRTQTDRLCGAGTCGSVASTDSQSCARDTDGDWCEDWPSCSRGRCAAGVCPSGPGCSFPRRCCEPGICVDRDSFCP